MNKKNVFEVRQAFLDFFSNKDHAVMAGSSLLPDGDTSLLFTNAGMNQFKNFFLGLDQLINKRIVTVQRCVRAGGKHNDLENVGYTNHHLTFFEMLGNFSFGDYFKDDAILFAWELLTSSRWFNLSKDKILITVHIDDEVSYKIWHNKIGVSDKHIIRIGNKKKDDCVFSDNFWQMGDVGPCGYCSEIFYNVDEENVEGTYKIRVGNNLDNSYVEIWNLVFMEFNRQINGDLLPLPILSVDTGMGLERISSVLQSVNSSYEIDLFHNLMISIVKIIGFFDFANTSFRILADHIRTCSFLISDGVYPSNSGHGYVLRRIVRRAVRHGKILGIPGMFFYKLVSPLVSVMGHLNIQLVENENNIKSVLFNEEKQFLSVLEIGLEMLKKEFSGLSVGDVLDGEKIFHFYSTYGFPFQFTKDLCLRFNFKVDEIGFNRSMLNHKKNAQRSTKFFIDVNKLLSMHTRTIFIGDKELLSKSQVLSIFKNNESMELLLKDEFGFVLLDKTPFYGESGGQIGDCGKLRTDFVYFEVLQTKKYGQVFGHWGRVVNGILRVGDYVTAQVDLKYRKCISANHSATHLLHSALIDVLGGHVVQRGSLINNQYLRFDFLHDVLMANDQISLVEDIVNDKIRNNLLVHCEYLPINIALSKGAKTVFGKRYDKIVRVVNIGDFSVELCGGTHVVRTGDIGLFIIRSESAIASGIRRIEAVCGMEACFIVQQQKYLIKYIANQLKGNNENLVKKVNILCGRLKELEKELDKCRDRQIIEEIKRLIKNIFYVGNIKLIIDYIYYNFNLKILRVIVRQLRCKLGSGVIVVISMSSSDDIVKNIVVSVTEDLICYVNAVEIISYLNNIFGGSGGGRVDLAQSAGGNIKSLPNVIDILDLFLTKKFESYNL